ncbi:MAG TPA: FAD-binding oxidoreductase [Devosia sp.]|jgi:D-amino-acid dehydrogenase|uniref:NAD(P)/FAD-dependent oxidoreductase n=1 Tax=Devosia sp. TaxID=1871048 RepID=UPI002DDDA03C|nr:FAD-binding oxidoreductase [Devosia sp.]HEV2516629.1 FAD-binding oxidoreductase [Devosia sp.]
MQADSIVLGAGMVGVSVAVHLQMRGRATVLVDRRGAGEETSYGNAGLIQREAVMPHAFPQGLGDLFRYGLNNRTDMHYHLGALPRIAPFLARYWWNSRPDQYRRIVETYAPLIAQSINEHAPLIERAGAGYLIEKKGWYQLFRGTEKRDEAFRKAESVSRDFGIGSAQLSSDEMHRREPGLGIALEGALHWTDPWSIRDPGALVVKYRELFEQVGGVVVNGDALDLQQATAGWRLPVAGGVLEAREAVIALGPWADDLTSRLGYRLPLGVKRGYHMHYGQPTTQPLSNWVFDASYGYLLTPMAKGIRLTSGAEFALRDAPSTPVQVDRDEPFARELFPGLGQRLEAQPWRGARPATPDMMPIIGPAPRHKGLWFAFGHAHHGLTLGPVTGRLIAEMITGEAPFVDPTAFSATRFM